MAEEHEIIYDAYQMFINYLDALHKELSEPDDQAGGAAHDERKSAYEAITTAPASLAGPLRQQFDQQYGANEWTHQQALHLARQWRDANAAQPSRNGNGNGTTAGGY